jgi:hypothetical protein
VEVIEQVKYEAVSMLSYDGGISHQSPLLDHQRIVKLDY